MSKKAMSMPEFYCSKCGTGRWWSWEEAFSKFGFNDGDGDVYTDEVVAVLENAGYKACAEKWGIHNVVISSIEKDGVELIPDDVGLGYGDPRKYLPAEIVTLLDEKL